MLTVKMGFLKLIGNSFHSHASDAKVLWPVCLCKVPLLVNLPPQLIHFSFTQSQSVWEKSLHLKKNLTLFSVRVLNFEPELEVCSSTLEDYFFVRKGKLTFLYKFANAKIQTSLALLVPVTASDTDLGKGKLSVLLSVCLIRHRKIERKRIAQFE